MTLSSSNEYLCEIKSKRRCTDKAFFVIFGLSLIALVAFVGYCINHGDLDLIINGYDDCGNICGKNNINADRLNLECYGRNMEQKKYLSYEVVDNFFERKVTKKCVENCSSFKQQKDLFRNRCYEIDQRKIEDNYISKLYETLTYNRSYIVIMSFFAILLSFAIMLMFRYKTRLAIHLILFGFTTLCIGLTIFFWVRLNKLNRNGNFTEHKTFFILSIIATVFTIILLFILFAMRKSLLLVTAIFKESTKAIADMPLLLLQPLMTCLSVSLVIICGIYTTLWIASSGYPKKLSETESMRQNRNPGSVEFEMDNVANFTIYYNYFIIMWMIQFVVGCQHIIVGGSVAKWFFTRNKFQLNSPISTSVFNLFRYHLGTVCFGSLIIAIVGIVKTFIRGLKSALSYRETIYTFLLYGILKYILELLELALKFFSRNCYIQTAIHGYSFCKAGRRAFYLLMENIFHVVIINSVGDYILYITKFFVTVITMLFTALLLWFEGNTEYIMSTIIITGFISFLIAHSFLTIYEMAIDTIFLCFCEDCEVNDGISKPYFMSRNLMEIIEQENNKHKNKRLNHLQLSDY